MQCVVPWGTLAAPRQAGGEASCLPGTASVAVRALLEGPRRPARVLAAFPSAVYVEMRTAAEPRVVAVVTAEAVRLPVAVVLAVPTHLAPLGPVRAGDVATVGDGVVQAGALHVHTARWWDPTPRVGRVEPGRLRDGLAALRAALDAAPTRPGLAGHPAPRVIAAACAEGDLARAVDTAERLVGLGPGLTPSGDDMLAGLLLALRLFGGALKGGRGAVALADWLAAAVTSYADTRTTSVAATLLHCAARGEAAAEVSAALRAIAGHEAVGPALGRLFSVGHTSGVDLACGLLAGGLACLRIASLAAGRCAGAPARGQGQSREQSREQLQERGREAATRGR